MEYGVYDAFIIVLIFVPLLRCFWLTYIFKIFWEILYINTLLNFQIFFFQFQVYFLIFSVKYKFHAIDFFYMYKSI